MRTLRSEALQELGVITEKKAKLFYMRNKLSLQSFRQRSRKAGGRVCETHNLYILIFKDSFASNVFPFFLKERRLKCWCESAQYLLQYQVDPVHLAVDEEALLLPAVHLLNDAPVLCGIHNVPHRASCHLPIIGNSRLHYGLEDCKT